MFNFLKKKDTPIQNEKKNFEIELTASILAYEIARADGDVAESELKILLTEVEKIASNVGKSADKILLIIKEFSNKSVSFHEFIEDINKEYTKDQKILLIDFLWRVAYADSSLEVQEERLIRRIANLIHIKDIEVLKLKDKTKS
jgi:uncharacterized tellurite resistance protein B-like protein|tara:strand:+ start:889 stop:1320 length:432 start_codon:yes stop_codon:yes gene_type:complete